MFTKLFQTMRSVVIVRAAFASLVVFSLFAGFTNFRAVHASENGTLVTVEMLEQATAILFPAMPSNTVKTAVSFAEMLNTNPERKEVFLVELGNVFIEGGKTGELQPALMKMIQNEPELTLLSNTNGEDAPPMTDDEWRLVIIIILILL